MDSLIAFDIGSGSIRASLALVDGTLLARARVPTPVRSPSEGAVEYDGGEVLDAVLDLLRQMARQAGKDRVAGIGFSCLGTSMVAVDADGRHVQPGLSPLDSRVSVDLPEGVDTKKVYRRTGQNPAAVSAFHQLRSEVGAVDASRTACLLSLRGLALQELCGVRVEDRSWASRTMLYDLQQGDWADDLAGLAGVDRKQLPELTESTRPFPVREDVIERFGLAPGAVAVPGGIDNCCAILGSGAGEGALVNIMGTYEHMAGRVTGDKPPEFAVSGGHLAFRWLWPNELLVCSRAATGHKLRRLLGSLGERAAKRYLDTGVPPSPNVQAPDADHAAILRLLDDSAFALRSFMENYEEAVGPCRKVVAVGGGAGSTAALQRKANALGKTLEIAEQAEASSLGALQLAWCGMTGGDQDQASRVFPNPPARVVEPEPDARAAFDQEYREWMHECLKSQ